MLVAAAAGAPGCSKGRHAACVSLLQACSALSSEQPATWQGPEAFMVEAHVTADCSGSACMRSRGLSNTSGSAPTVFQAIVCRQCSGAASWQNRWCHQHESTLSVNDNEPPTWVQSIELPV